MHSSATWGDYRPSIDKKYQEVKNFQALQAMVDGKM